MSRRRKHRHSRARNLTAQPHEVLIIETTHPGEHAANTIASRMVRDAMEKGEAMIGSNGTAPTAVKPTGTPEVPNRNRMGRHAQRRLEDWIESIWPTVATNRPTRQELATEACKALAMPVSMGNVTGAIKALGRTLPTPAATTKAGKTAAERKRYRFAVLVAQVEAMRKEIGAAALPEWTALYADMSQRIDDGKLIPPAPPAPDRFNPSPTRPR